MGRNPDAGPLGVAWRDARRPRDRGGCPGAAQLARLLDRATAGAEADALRAHVAVCTACADELRLLMALEPEIAAFGAVAEQPADRRTGWRRTATPWLAAAGVLLSVGLLSLLWQPLPGPGERVVRGAATLAVVPASGALLEAAPPVLQWPATASARRYRVELFDHTGTPLWEGVVEGAELAVPAALHQRFSSGQTYLWQVTPEAPGAVAQGPYWFTLAPR